MGTVSHALNDMSDISAATKERVRLTAERMGYVSDGRASSLRSGKSKLLAVIIADIVNPHIARRCGHRDSRRARAGYSIMILNTNEDASRERKAIYTAVERRADGILYVRRRPIG